MFKWHVHPKSNALIYGQELALDEPIELGDHFVDNGGSFLITQGIRSTVGWDKEGASATYTRLRYFRPAPEPQL